MTQLIGPKGLIVSNPPGGPASLNDFGDYWPPELFRVAVVNGIAAANTSQRNKHPIITYNDAINQNGTIAGVMAPTYLGGNLVVNIDWVAASIVGTVRWAIQWERLNAAGPDIDIDNFAAALTVDDTPAGTSGVITRTQFTFTQAQADGVAAADAFRMLIFRDITVGGNMVGDAQLLQLCATG